MIEESQVSYEEIKKDLKDYIDALPENKKWVDFLESSTGTTLVELLSGFGAYIAFKYLVLRRETFLSSCKVRSSALAIAEQLGYSSFRGRNKHLRLNITPSTAKVVNRLDLLGKYKQYDLIAANDYVFNSGVAIDVEVIVGEFKTSSITVTTEDPTMFRFTEETISDDFQLKLNDVLLPVSDKYKDLINDKYLAITNPLNSLDIMHLNAGSFNYTIGDILKVEYAKYEEIKNFDITKIEFYFGIINIREIYIDHSAPEAIDSIRINAPVHHETQLLIRGRDDYKKLAKNIIPNCADTNGHDANYCYGIVEISYVRNDLTLLTPAEETALLAELDTYRPFGIPLPVIIPPIQNDVALDISITLDSTDVAVSEIEDDLDTILSNYQKKLGIEIVLDDLERDIEKNSYVKIARVTSASNLVNIWNQYSVITYNLVIN